jgi:3-methyl-2-oxobutanoate hydroxymethyltransferase
MRTSIIRIREMKQKGEKITMLTAYDYSTAMIVDEVGIPLILVGDSLGMTMLGYETPIPVTMEDMLMHVKAVVRGTKNALIVGDMPFMTYHVSTEQAVTNAGRFLQEGGCQSVKLEGGVNVAERIKRIVDSGIPVCGHIGLTPQSLNQLGGYRIQGRNKEAAIKVIKDAEAVEQAGAYAVVLETVPAALAALISKRLAIPTIGIGAGAGCDGQVQVIHDILGLYPNFVPKHAKQYANVHDVEKNAIANYMSEVKSGTFPTEANSFPIDAGVIKELEAELGK